MKTFFSILCLLSSLIAFEKAHSTDLYNSQLPLLLSNNIKTEIVRGQATNEGAWPWMSALVYTNRVISSTLSVDGNSYTSQAFTYGSVGTATGETVDCGLGDAVCLNAQNKICLIERGITDFSAKALNCANGGGSGVIIYNNVDGLVNGTLGSNFSNSITVLSVSKADGEILKNNIGTVAQLAVTAQNATQQSIKCGATLIGKKWLLTAAHCVEDINADELFVNVGEYDLSNGAQNASEVKNIYIHPAFSVSRDLDSDIALIELFNESDITPITLLSSSNTTTHTTNNSSVKVLGWGGRTPYDSGDAGTGDYPEILHQADLNLLSNLQCKNALVTAYENSFNNVYSPDNVGITDNMICAIDSINNQGSCQGDSGGPLIINTSNGWQQIGIVSWGVGCGSEGFPDVYTRIGEFTSWINTITKGVAIEPIIDFGFQAISDETNPLLTKSVNVTNNSQYYVNLSFSTLSNSVFNINTNNCLSLASGASCDLQIAYNNTNAGVHSQSLIISTDNNNVLANSVTLKGETLEHSALIESHLSSDTNNLLSWYSGGDLIWQTSSASNTIESGAVTDNQKSILIATFPQQGELTFEWSVSSEENTNEPNLPFDALFLYLDDTLVDFISGNVAFTQVSLSIPEGTHQVTWIYKKDAAVSELEDKGLIRNITFIYEETNEETSESSTENSDETSTETSTSTTTSTTKIKKSSSGGSVFWLVLLSTLFLLQRKYSRKVALYCSKMY